MAKKSKRKDIDEKDWLINWLEKRKDKIGNNATIGSYVPNEDKREIADAWFNVFKDRINNLKSYTYDKNNIPVVVDQALIDDIIHASGVDDIDSLKNRLDSMGAKGLYISDSNSIFYPSEPSSGVAVHEISHALHDYTDKNSGKSILKDAVGSYMDENEYLLDNVKPSTYYESTNEIYSRLNEFRRNNDLSPDKEFTDDEVRGMRKNPNIKDSGLFERYNDGFIKHLLNNVAYNDSADSNNVIIAKDGGSVSNWKPSKDVVDFLISYEGFSPTVEVPTKRNKKTGKEDVETTGFGVTDRDIVKRNKGKTITRAQARKDFDIAVKRRVRQFIKATPNFDKLNDNERDALFSYFYNIGYGEYKNESVKLQKALTNLDRDEIVRQMDYDYNNQDRKGAMKRRNAEHRLFMLPVGEKFVPRMDSDTLSRWDDKRGSVYYGEIQEPSLNTALIVNAALGSKNMLDVKDGLLNSILGIKNDLDIKHEKENAGVPKTRDEAFREARKKGLKTFEWNGKKYTTEIKAEGGMVGNPQGDDWTSEDLFNPVYSKQSHTSSAQKARDNKFKKELQDSKTKGFTDYIVPAISNIADFVPGIGEAKSAMEAIDSYTKNKPGEAALYAIGAIPAVGIFTKGKKIAGKAAGRAIMEYREPINRVANAFAEVAMFPKKIRDAMISYADDIGDNISRTLVEKFPMTPWAKEIADEKAVEAAKKGSNWLHDYYDDPETLKKIERVLIEDGGVNYPPERMAAMKEMGLIDEDGRILVDKYKELFPLRLGSPSVMRDGRTLGGHISLERNKEMLDEGGDFIGDAVFHRVGPYYRSPKKVSDIAAHESNHLMQEIYNLDKWQKYDGDYYIPDTDTFIGRLFDEVSNKATNDNWYRSPSELHSKLIEYKRRNGLKPGDEITDEMLKGMSKDKYFSGFIDFKNGDKKKIKELLNLLPAALPVAGVTAYSLSNPEEFSEGGMVVDNYDMAWDYLVNEREIDPKSAIAIMANLENESGLDYSSINSIGAMGIQQWLGPRKKALIKKYGNTPSLRQQLEFLVDEYEGNHGYSGWNFKTKGKNLGSDRFNYYMYSKSDFDNAPTIEDKTIAWNQGFGRPATWELRNKDRMASAKRLAMRYGVPYERGSYNQFGTVVPEENMPKYETPVLEEFARDVVNSIAPYSGTMVLGSNAKEEPYEYKSEYAKKVDKMTEEARKEEINMDIEKMKFFDLVWNSINLRGV